MEGYRGRRGEAVGGAGNKTDDWSKHVPDFRDSSCCRGAYWPRACRCNKQQVSTSMNLCTDCSCEMKLNAIPFGFARTGSLVVLFSYKTSSEEPLSYGIASLDLVPNANTFVVTSTIGLSYREVSLSDMGWSVVLCLELTLASLDAAPRSTPLQHAAFGFTLRRACGIHRLCKCDRDARARRRQV